MREIELAEEICAEAEELHEALKKSKKLNELPLRTRLVQGLAAACLQVFRDAAEKDNSMSLRKLLTDLARDPNACDRDELERLMFFHKVLIDFRELFGLPPYESLKHIAQLLTYCRSACRLDTPDPELLAYLRPYYDSAFVAQNELLPGHAKELIEIAWEATRGRPYMKPGAIQPLLVMYVARGKCHLLLDAPGGASQTFALDEVESEEQLIAASTNKEFATLPDQVRKTLREVQSKQAQPIVLRWRDPVLRIGYVPMPPMPNSPVDIADSMNRVVAFKPLLEESELKPATECVFPFNLQGILKPEQFSEDTNGLIFKRAHLLPTAGGSRPAEQILTQKK